MLNIVLLEPEIPANTGNIGRTCVAIGAKLHLIEPMGFKVNDKQVKRAGLDYWPKLDYQIYDCYTDFMKEHKDATIYYATTKGGHIYSDVTYDKDCYIMFGKESAGIPEDILREHKDKCIRIPMYGDIRSLNLGNSVATIAYEVKRQQGFKGLRGESDYLKDRSDKKRGFMREESRERILYYIGDYLRTDKVKQMKKYIQHGKTTTYKHAVNVAKLCYIIDRKYKLGSDLKVLLTAALFHDFYLYDWHSDGLRHGLHGYSHPKKAAENAKRYYNIDEKTYKAIRSHMWPLTAFHIPASKEAWILCVADKLASISESLWLDKRKGR